MIKEALDEYAKKIDRQFRHDRRRTVGASEIGLCERKIHWVKNGGNRDADYINHWGAHVRGTFMEKYFWLPALKEKYGDNILFAGEGQVSLEENCLSATPDALLVNAPLGILSNLGVESIERPELLLECKTIDPRANLSRERDSNHFQVQVQMGIMRRTTEYAPEYALISYTDASFWSDVAEYPVKYDDTIYHAAQIRAERILTLHPADLKPEGWIAGGAECEHCPFTKACGIVRRSVPEQEAAADPQFVAEIVDMCRDLLDAQDTVDGNEREVRTIQQEIRDRLREKGIKKIPGVISWSAVKGRTNYDMKGIREAAAAAGVDVEAFSTSGEPSDRLQILVGRSNGRY